MLICDHVDDHMRIILTAALSGSGCLIMIFIITITLVLTAFSAKRCSNNNQQKFNMDCNDAYTRRTSSRSAHQEVVQNYDQKFNMDCNDAYTRRTLSRSAHQEVGGDYDQKFNMDCNDAYTRRTLSRSAHHEVGEDNDIVDTDSEVNVACRSSDKVPSAIGSTTEHSSSHEYEDNLVQNVAYVDKQLVIPVSPNAAYSSHQLTTFQEDDVDQYMYV